MRRTALKHVLRIAIAHYLTLFMRRHYQTKVFSNISLSYNSQRQESSIYGNGAAYSANECAMANRSTFFNILRRIQQPGLFPGLLTALFLKSNFK